MNEIGYSLISENEEENILVSNEITKVLVDTSKKIKDISKKYPNTGITDTTSLEEITGYLYTLIKVR